MENKKGYTTVMIIFATIIALAVIVGLATVSFGAGLIDETMTEINFDLGNQSFGEEYNQTLKPALNSIEITGPKMMSIGIILGMVLVCLAIAYVTPNRHKLWILLDVGVLIIAEIFAVAIRDMFRDNIMNMSPEFYNIFITTLSSGSKWILQMPIITPVIGVLMILVTYLIKKVKPTGEGFYQIQDE